jgi:hypothetical protein
MLSQKVLNKKVNTGGTYAQFGAITADSDKILNGATVNTKHSIWDLPVPSPGAEEAIGRG